MAEPAMSEFQILQRSDFQSLFDVLKNKQYRVVGPRYRRVPTAREGTGAIHLEEINGVEDLPEGWTDEQNGGVYRLKRQNDKALFAYSNPQHSTRNFFFQSSVKLSKGERSNGAFSLEEEERVKPRFAFIGVRSCDLYAVHVQDRVFLKGKYNKFEDSFYKTQREESFFVGVSCTRAGNTCFCASQKTGPEVNFNYDLALTELIRNGKHEFLVKIGSQKGQEVADLLPLKPVLEEDIDYSKRLTESCSKNMGRILNNEEIKELLYANYHNPRWKAVGDRCLACTNCTMVCPTCFCSTTEDFSSLDGAKAERWRKWDVCYTMGFSYLHGESIRTTNQGRYRHWLNHKLGTWWDQFEISGCVGCGRCITWCPVGIDITEEAKAIRDSDMRKTGEEHADVAWAKRRESA